MMNDISLLFMRLVVAVAVSLITGYLIPFLKEQYNTKLDDKTKKMIQTAIEAAEQSIQGDKKGAARKEAVFKFVMDWAERNGVHLSKTDLDILIDAAVRAMNKQDMIDFSMME